MVILLTKHGIKIIHRKFAHVVINQLINMKRILFIFIGAILIYSCNNNPGCPKPQQDNSSPQTSFKLLEDHAVRQNDTLVVEHIDNDGSEKVYLKRIK